MEDLVREYRAALREVNKARFTATDEEDKKLLASCADSMRYAIEYMELGQEPGNRRAISRRAGIQREVPTDPQSAVFIKAAVLQRRPKDNLTQDQKDLLEDLLAVLTMKEKEAFIIVRGSGYSFGEAATLMDVKKGTVQNLVARAEHKLCFVVRMPTNSNRKVCSIKFKAPVQRVLL